MSVFCIVYDIIMDFSHILISHYEEWNDVVILSVPRVIPDPFNEIASLRSQWQGRWMRLVHYARMTEKNDVITRSLRRGNLVGSWSQSRPIQGDCFAMLAMTGARINKQWQIKTWPDGIFYIIKKLLLELKNDTQNNSFYLERDTFCFEYLYKSPK